MHGALIARAILPLILPLSPDPACGHSFPGTSCGSSRVVFAADAIVGMSHGESATNEVASPMNSARILFSM